MLRREKQGWDRTAIASVGLTPVATEGRLLLQGSAYAAKEGWQPHDHRQEHDDVHAARGDEHRRSRSGPRSLATAEPVVELVRETVREAGKRGVPSHGKPSWALSLGGGDEAGELPACGARLAEARGYDNELTVGGFCQVPATRL